MGTYWIAYYCDWSGFAVFLHEIDCLRYAVKHDMQAAEVAFGVDPREAVR